MNRLSDVKDLTAKNRANGGGMNMDRLYLCGHKGGTTGALMKHGITMLCAKCNGKEQRK